MLSTYRHATEAIDLSEQFQVDLTTAAENLRDHLRDAPGDFPHAAERARALDEIVQFLRSHNGVSIEATVEGGTGVFISEPWQS